MNRSRVCIGIGCLVALLLHGQVFALGGRAIRVALVLLDAPSNQSTVADPFTLSTQVTEFAQMPAGSKVYLEAWVSTEWPDGLTGAGVDVTYDPAIVSTFCDANDAGYPLNCQVDLGNWASFARCPEFTNSPTTVCSSSGRPCTTDADCKACVGGANDGDACAVGNKVCSTSGDLCTTDSDCNLCVGGFNDGLGCSPDGATLCSLSAEPCVTGADCGTCASGDFDGEACYSGGVCSATGAKCNFGCVGGDNNGLPCADDLDCPNGTCESDWAVCLGGVNNGVSCVSDADCPDGTCEADCKTCVGGPNNGLPCTVNCPGGLCKVSAETCGPQGLVCSATGASCTGPGDCFTCTAGANQGLACTIGAKVCSSTGATCSTAADCFTCSGGANNGLACTVGDKVCSISGELCTTATDCKVCAGGTNPGAFCTSDVDCPGGGVCLSVGETCDDIDCPGGACQVSGEACEDADCPGGACAVSSETCDDPGCTPGGTCDLSGETCDVEDCLGGGLCMPSSETCDDVDCSPGGACQVSGETCETNLQLDCVPVPGVVQNMGGNNLSGLAFPGTWERIGTIEFDVTVTPTSLLVFSSGQDESAPGGGRDLMLAFWGGGLALPSEVSFFDWAVPGGAADADGDGLLDPLDNCPNDFNPGQEDTDECVGGSNEGNPCLVDSDCPGGGVCEGDGVGDVCDNCPDHLNSSQLDSDTCLGGTNDGNPCVTDADCPGGGTCLGDGTGDVCDNCPDTLNQDQEDSDECVGGTNAGNPCVTDAQCSGGTCAGDGVGNLCDNCPDNLNMDQADCDSDGVGDACELDTDSDGVPDDCDPCPLDNPDDTDFDGVCDSDDICPGGDDNIDGDGDGVPDDCDPCPIDNPDDSDGDGVCDSVDICPGGDDNLDNNNNGIPDECEVHVPLPADPPNDRLKNRYISFAPNNVGLPVKFKVRLSLSLPHPGSIGDSWWVQAPVVTEPDQFPKPLVGPGECVALLGLESTAAVLDWDAAGCQTLHVTGCPIEPTSEYEVEAVADVSTSAPLTVATALEPNEKFWGDTVGFFDSATQTWTPPQGVVSIDDAVAVIKTFQGGQVVPPGPNPPGNVAHLSVADVEPGDTNTVVNFADVLTIILAFQGDPYPFGPAGADGRCP